MWDRNTPAISTALRGLVGEEVTIKAADRDLHSGHYGSAARNPIHLLVDVLAALHDEDGKVMLDGFYDAVPELPAEIKAQWDDLGFSESDFLGEIGLSIPAGEKGRSVLEMTWSRPTCEISWNKSLTLRRWVKSAREGRDDLEKKLIQKNKRK